MDKHTTPATESKPTRRFPPGAAAGLLLSPLAFVFGAPAALIVLPAALPVLKRLRPAAYACLAGIALCWLLSLAGLNPWVALAKAHALNRIQAALGAPMTSQDFSASVISGEMSFHNVRSELPEGVGTLEASRIQIEAGYGLLLGARMPAVTVWGLRAEFDPSRGKLENYLRREATTGQAVLTLVGGRILLGGEGTSAEFELSSGHGIIEGDSVELNLGMSAARVAMLGKSYDVDLRGGLSIRRAEQSLTVVAEMGFSSVGLLHGYLQGRLGPDGGALHITLDQLELEPVWSRYRKLDRLSGNLRGSALLSGELSDLRFDLNLHVRDLSYFHRVAMSLDETRSFRIPDGVLVGGVTVREGRDWLFHALTLRSDDCTLSTGPAVSAAGSGVLVLDGPVKALNGRLDAIVESGRISAPVGWWPLGGATLSDMRPNLALLGEQFPALGLRWTAEVRSMEVACHPLYGEAHGRLRGTFLKEAGWRRGVINTQGRLELRDGSFRFLGSAGDVNLALEFSPDLPAAQASMRGSLAGSAGETPINASISGSLQRPALHFTGITMAPEKLGGLIFGHSETPLTPAQISARRVECSRLFGPVAASRGNPFFIGDSRHAFLSFSPD